MPPRRGHSHHPPCPSGHRVVHFDIPTADGREIISVDRRGNTTGLVPLPRGSNRDQLAAGLDDGPMIFVVLDRDGNYSTDYGVPGQPFRSIDQLMHAVIGVHCADLSPSEVEHVGATASSQTLQQPDVSALKELLNTTTLEESSITATSSSSKQDTIWFRNVHEWGIKFYTRDVAYELKDVVHYVWFHDGDSDIMYYHINFTAKTKGADDGGIYNLFFTEVTCLRTGPKDWVVSCICMVNPSDNGRCHACANKVKHPKADAYTGGHSEGGHLKGLNLPYTGPNKDVGKTAAELEAKEAWVRLLYKGLDDPLVMEPVKLKSPGGETKKGAGVEV